MTAQAAPDRAPSGPEATAVGVKVSLPADPKYLKLISGLSRKFCQATAGDSVEDQEQFLYNVELVITEACVNVFRHAYRGDPDGLLELELRWDEDRLTIVVADYGKAFGDFDEYIQRDINDVDPLSTGGRGLIIMRSLMNGVSYRTDRASGRNELVMIRDLARSTG